MKPLSNLCLCVFLFLPYLAKASGLEQLKQRLNQLKASSPVTITLHVTNKEQRGSGDNASLKKGEVILALAETAAGLAVSYSRETLLEMQQEEDQRLQDEDVNTPVLNALNSLNTTDFRNSIASSTVLLRNINKAQFIDEKATIFDGREARKLSFELPLEVFIHDKKMRQNVDEFSSRLYIWIDDEGTPLESKMTFEGEGRAYLFLSMEAKGENISRYTLVKDRLVTVHNTFSLETDATWGERLYQSTKTAKATN